MGGNNGSICGKHDGYFSIKSLPALPTALTSLPSQVNPFLTPRLPYKPSIGGRFFAEGDMT